MLRRLVPVAANLPFVIQAYVGLDAGGTRTRAVVTSFDLVPLGRGASGPANASTENLPTLVETLVEAVDDALAAAGVSVPSVKRISCGVAGVAASARRHALERALSERYGENKALVFTDARIALAGATRGSAEGAGIVLIAGTGAIAFGRNDRADEARAGGWGALLDDEGSGYAIARRGLVAALRQIDGRGPATLISDLLIAADRSAADIVQSLYRVSIKPTDVAAYYPVVLEAARKGDRVARAILANAAEELALAVTTVIKRLEMEEDVFPVATVGGVFSAGELLVPALTTRILEVAPGAIVGPPAYPPEIGAIRLALAAERPEAPEAT